MPSKKMLNVSIDPSKIMHISLDKSKGGYSRAALSAKIADGEYMSVRYEWEGDVVPDFAMDVMGFVKANKEEVDKAVANHTEEYEKLMAKKSKKGDKKGC